MQVEFHPLFQSDLETAADYYLKQAGQSLAEEFISEVQDGIHRIAQNPLAPAKQFGDVRRLRLKRFKAYSIRYRFNEKAELIFIGSLLHGSRHPDTGKERFGT